MAKVYAPNEQYTGISAGVPFAGGVGETDDKKLLSWFQAHGYTVKEEQKAPRKGKNGKNDDKGQSQSQDDNTEKKNPNEEKPEEEGK